MASFVPTSAETLEDQRLYTRARLIEVACLDCLARVGVKKNSEHHTSIQWNAEALEHVPGVPQDGVRARRARTSTRAAPRLRSSIERAVADGQIAIGAQDGY